MKNKYFVVIICLLFSGVHAQTIDFNDFTPVNSKGELPPEFSTSSVQKYREAAKKISSKKSKIEKEALRDYELESSYAIDDILHSGKVIFNDTISNYVNAVMHKLMEQREKKKNVRVYVLRSSVVNAFSTGKGIIFITMGLLARMHSEAELAFVLSHEYIHYLKKHTINEYIENTKEKHNRGAYQSTSIDDRYLRRANFSKELELEADELGFDLFSKTNYDLSATVTALNTILYYYMPFDSVSISPSFFEIGSFKIPEKYFNKTYTPVNAYEYEKNTTGFSKPNDNEDDEGEDNRDKYSTHPSTDKRIEKLEALKRDFGNSGNRSLYMVSENSFRYIRKVCRFEIPRINLLDGNYEDAIYHALVLLHEENNSFYLKKIIGKGLYSLAKYGNNGNFNSVHHKFKNEQGTYQQLLYLTGNLKAQGISAAALNYCWKLKTQNLNDFEMYSICNSLMASIVFKYEDVKNHTFFRSESDTVAGKIKRKHKSIDDDAKTKDEESDKKKKKNAKQAVESDEDEPENKKNKAELKLQSYFRSAFIYWFQKDTDFTTLFDEKMKELEVIPSAISENSETKSNVLPFNTSENKYVLNNKVLFINPFYAYASSANYYSNTNYDPIKSEENKERFTGSLINVAGRTFNEFEILDQDFLKLSESQKLSDISILKDCLLENIDKSDAGLVSTDLNQVKQIMKKYNSTNIILTGMYIEKMKINSIGAVCIGFYSLFYYPIFIAQMMPKSYQYAIFTVMYNSDADNFRVNYYKLITGKDTPTSLNANLFQIFSRLKTY